MFFFMLSQWLIDNTKTFKISQKDKPKDIFDIYVVFTVVANCFTVYATSILNTGNILWQKPLVLALKRI